MTAIDRGRRATVALALASAFVGCGRLDTADPLPQVVLHLATDAPLPPPPGTKTTSDAAPALFDRVLFEVFPPGASDPCAGCSRDFAIDRVTVADGHASVGAAYPAGADGYRARVRLYRSSFLERYGPRPASTLDTVIALPVLPSSGVVDLAVVLRVADLGAPRGTLAEPVPAERGVPAAFPAWSMSARVPCPTSPPEGMACAPGGAFWMGDPSLVTLRDYGLEGVEERLVVLSPFFVDRHEVTVADVRASGRAVKDASGRFVDPVERDGATTPSCTFTHDPATIEQHPANCLTWQLARSYCEARGARLPTEAELEYLLGGTQGRPFVWGYDPPRCEDATAERNENARDDQVSCIGQGIGADDVGRGKRDRLALPGGELVDIAGNVSELAADVFSLVGEGYWKAGVFVDPLANVPDGQLKTSHAMRGGNFEQQRGLMRSAIRQYLADGTTDPDAGFRCARSAR